MAQGIYRHMHLRASTAFRAVIPCTWATFGGRLERAAIEDGRRGFGVASLGQPQHRAQIVDDGVAYPGLEPPLTLLLHRGSSYAETPTSLCSKLLSFERRVLLSDRNCLHFDQEIGVGQAPHFDRGTGGEGPKVLHPDVHMLEE